MNKFAGMTVGFAVIMGAACGGTASSQTDASEIRLDEEVVFFSTCAHQSDDGQSWNVPVHGWIFEPEEDDLLRAAALRELDDALKDKLTAEEAVTLAERLRPFLVDNERNKQIAVRIAGSEHRLPQSAADGHFQGTLALSVKEVAPHLVDGRLALEAITRPGDDRPFQGAVDCLPPVGVSVISDVDDTIKVSHVRDFSELLQNTFLREFKPVAGMPEVYRRWHKEGAHFHYVSATPWQLYAPLTEFLVEAGFPQGDFHLKRFRPKASTLRNLFADPYEYKLSVIEPLLQQFPQRQFILVGDSGERDPEAYATLARRYPNQILRIFIRDVTGDAADSPRYKQAFQNLPRDKWQVFADPKEVGAQLP